jgi:hypothetical protein
MQSFKGRITEIWLENGQLAGRMACPPQGMPAAGQYLLAQAIAQAVDGPPEALPVILFPARLTGEGFHMAPPLPGGWLPGLELDLRGPFGRGFQLPVHARHVALAALDAPPARLLPLAIQALTAGREVTLFCDLASNHFTLSDLPSEIEVDALAAFAAALPWADAAFLDLPVSALPGLRGRLGIKAGERLPCPAQALTLAPMPCGGLAECGVCAVPLRGSRGSSRPSWALACKDGPVFDLDLLEW